ncbi:MAG: FAD-binding oxidoreductase [Pseudomonadota bacterium]|nr:FAD-binding oxidoreductase [Pseudomonadota bacterium]
MSEVVEKIREMVGDTGVLTGNEVSERIAVWGTNEPMRALAIVRPRTVEEVSQVLKICHAAGQSVVPQGGMTGLVKGGVPNEQEIALSMERMTGIVEIDRDTATMTVETGVTLQAAQEAAAEAGMMLPLDLGARGSATIGGNLSTNAGGNRVIRYGMMRDMVLGLEAVLADGTILSSLHKILKNNTGYDLKQLFIGGEGTLGIVTKAVLRLRPKPLSEETAFVAVDGFDNVTALLRHMDARLSGTLSAFEVMWTSAYEILTGEHSHNDKPLPLGPSHFILVEALGGDPASDKERFENALGDAFEKGLVVDALIAQSEGERQSFWNIRDDVPAIRDAFRNGGQVSFDVSVPISEMEDYLAEVEAGLKARWPHAQFISFGHLGDSNLHLGAHIGPETSDHRHEIEELVFGPLMGRGGSISAEHGIGLLKREFLGLSRSPEELAVMRSLKLALDPKNILNPGKILPIAAA